MEELQEKMRQIQEALKKPIRAVEEINCSLMDVGVSAAAIFNDLGKDIRDAFSEINSRDNPLSKISHPLWAWLSPEQKRIIMDVAFVKRTSVNAVLMFIDTMGAPTSLKQLSELEKRVDDLHADSFHDRMTPIK